MTARFVTSAPTERSFQRVKQWQHPSRREFIHGPIQPMNLVTMGKRINSTRIALGIGLFAVVVFGGEEVRAIAFGTVATRHSTSQSSLSRPLSRRVSTIANSTKEK